MFSGPGGVESYDLYVDTNKLYFYRKVRDAERQKDLRLDFYEDKYFFKPSPSKTRHAPLTHWFYPDNVVMLTVPGAQSNHDVRGQLRKIGSQRGFIELKALLDGFKSPTTHKNTLYFVDQTGRTAKSLGEDAGAAFGTVTVKEVFLGPEGPYDRAKKLDVIAKLPGTLE